MLDLLFPKPSSQVNPDTMAVQFVLVIPQRLCELFLAWDLAGEQELAAQCLTGFVEIHRCAASGELQSSGHARRATSDHGVTAVQFFGRHLRIFRLTAGTGVDHAAGHFALERPIQTSLVAGDARVDFGLAPLHSLGHDLPIGEPRAGHGHEVGTPIGEHLLRHMGHVDAVGGDQRDAHLTHEFFRDPRKARAGHHGGDGRNAGLVPANAGVDDVRASGLDDLGLFDHLAPTAAFLHEVEHAQAVHDGKVRPAGLADARDDFFGEAHPVGQGTTPLVGAVVRSAGEELVDQIALRPHDLHPVVASFPSEQGTTHIIPNRPLHTPTAQDPWAELADGRLAFGRGHAKRVVAVASAVENLQGNPPARRVDCIGHFAVLGNLT